ncbi:MAG: M14-type cytosolic carboxypeptidase, partial [Bacteroidota bacterium]
CMNFKIITCGIATYFINNISKKSAMKKNKLFLITLFSIGCLFVNSQPITVSGGFEGSNVVDITQVSASSFTCKLTTPTLCAPESGYYNTTGDHYHGWFMLKIENAAGQTVIITITNADWGSGAFWGRADGKAVYTEAIDPYTVSSESTWQKLTTGIYSNPNATFTITPATNLAWLALSYPAMPTHTNNWISALSTNPDVSSEIVTSSSLGYPVWMLFVTDTTYPSSAKKTVLLYGQEHNSEQTGGWTCQGLVDFLVSGDPVAQQLLQNMIFIVIPDVGPDATYSGTANDPDDGTGAQWRFNPGASERLMPGMSVPMTQESKAIWNRIDQFVVSGNSIDFSFNIHQGGIDNWYGVYQLADPVANNFDGFLRNEMPLSGAPWIPNTLQGYSRGGWQNVLPTVWPSIRIYGRCWEEWRSIPMAYEMSVGGSATNFLNNVEGIKYFGKAIALALYDYYGSFNKSFTLTAPDGGEMLTSGGATNVTWTSAGSPGNVRIDCSTDGGAIWQNLVSSTANDGNETVTLPTANSNNCILRISSATAMGVNDKSNAVFTIGTPPASTINVTYPIGGETIDAYYWKAITWTSTGTLSKVNIEISTDGGTTWKRMAYAVTNNNSYDINVPGTISTQCLIKVTNAENISVTDMSDGFFTVQQQPAYPTIEVLYPNGGETFAPGTTATVTWSSTGFSSNVGIRISTDEGANWITLISSTANDGSENVTLPSVYSSKCRIWVYEATMDTYVNQPGAFPLDISNTLFTIDTITVSTPEYNVDSNMDMIKIFPNPAYEYIIVKTCDSKLFTNYTLSDIAGRHLISGKLNSNSTCIKINKLESGIYLLSLGEQSRQTFKVLKK